MNKTYTFDRTSNNFDFIRFIAAVFVVISHSYDLTDQAEVEPLRLLTFNSISLSYLGVRSFFLVSGYLIVKSFLASPSIPDYLYKRALRIFPGLFVALAFCVFIWGAVMTALPLNDYFSDSYTYSYFQNFLLYRYQPLLPKVLDDPMALVNGSIWTLVYEFTFYLVIMGLGITGILKRPVLVLLITSICIAIDSLINQTPFAEFYYPSVNMKPGPFFEFISFFLVGSLFHLYRNRIKITLYTGLAALVLFSISSMFLPPVYSRVVTYILLPYSLFFLAFIKGPLNAFGRHGDYSYGIYIYSYPIQKFIIRFFPAISTIMLVVFSIIAVMPFAYLSWNWVESKMLRFKKKPSLPSNQDLVTSLPV